MARDGDLADCHVVVDHRPAAVASTVRLDADPELVVRGDGRAIGHDMPERRSPIAYLLGLPTGRSEGQFSNDVPTDKTYVSPASSPTWMSTRDPDPGSHDWRQPTPRREQPTLSRWIDDVFYYGFAQVALLGLLALWTVLQTPFVDLAVKTSAVVAGPATMLTIGTLRSGLVSVGRPWPRLDGSRLGTGEGYQAYVTRTVYVSATLLSATYGGALVALVVGSSLAGVPVAAALAVGTTALLPHLTAPGRRRRLARGGFYVVGVGLAFSLSSPLDVSVGDPFVLTYFVALAALAAFDLSDRGWRNTDEQSLRTG